MKIRGACLFLALALSLGGLAANEPTTTFEVEVSPPKEKSERTPESDAKWFHRALSEAVGIPEDKIKTEAAGENRIKLHVAKPIAPLVKTVLDYFATNPALGFHPVHADSITLAKAVADGEHVVPGYRTFPHHESHVLVTIMPAVSGKHVKSAKAEESPQGWMISVDFDEDGATRMEKTTTENVGEQLAIMLGDRVISAPVIQAPFSTGCMISGDFTREEAVSLATFIGDPPPFTFSLKAAPKVPAP